MAWVDGTTAALREREGRLPPTAQQLAVLRWLSYGLQLPQVAYQLDMRLNTVKTHARRLYARLGASTAAHAVRIAFERGYLVEGDDVSDLAVPVDERELEDEVEA